MKTKSNRKDEGGSMKAEVGACGPSCRAPRGVPVSPQGGTRSGSRRTHFILHPSHFRPSSAFSLLELLIVLAIIMIMAALLLPAVGDTARRARFNKAISAVAAEMEIAQQAAVSGGTYAWVGFTTNYPPQMVTGRAIGGAAPTTNSITINLVTATNATQLGRVQTLENVLLRNTIVNASSYTTNRPLPAGATTCTNTPDDSSLKLSAKPPGSSPTTFDWAVEFNPMGEATVRTTAGAIPVSNVMVNLVPSPNGTIIETNRAGFVWINGLSGGVQIYQP